MLKYLLIVASIQVLVGFGFGHFLAKYLKRKGVK